MRNVYLDNAATTPIFEEVIKEMCHLMRTVYGNPSSSHQFGRSAKSIIENARKNIAKKLNVSSSEIIFTSGGTEANNLILKNAVVNFGVTRIITSKIEHLAVLNTLKELESEFGIRTNYVNTDAKGVVDYGHLKIYYQIDTIKLW